MNLETSLPLPEEPGVAPGSARCPGPSTRDIILADGQDVPPALIAEAYAVAGDGDISYDRYTSPDFMAREFTHMWARTWQWAAREEHVPEAGDYITYDIGPWSILIVRGDDGEIRAYRNVCLHRGTQLKRSDSSGNAMELRCPSCRPTGRRRRKPFSRPTTSMKRIRRPCRQRRMPTRNMTCSAIT